MKLVPCNIHKSLLKYNKSTSVKHVHLKRHPLRLFEGWSKSSWQQPISNFIKHGRKVGHCWITEFCDYLLTPHIPTMEIQLQWWATNKDGIPHLANLCKTYLTFPTTSTPSATWGSTYTQIRIEKQKLWLNSTMTVRSRLTGWILCSFVSPPKGLSQHFSLSCFTLKWRLYYTSVINA